MKKFLALISILFTALSLCIADPAEGYWISIDEKTNKETAGWKIWVENGKLTGAITSIAGFPQDQKAVGAKGKSYNDFKGGADIGSLQSVGTNWIYGLSNVSEGKWANGYIIDPNDGKRYNCKITFHKADGKKYKSDTLEMRGEIGMGIGRSQYWKKATKESAEGLR